MAKKIVKRLLAATFALGGGKTFIESGKNAVRLSGLRMKAKIDRAGGPSMSKLQLQIYGMTFSMMNQLSTLGMLVTMVQRNSITLEAGTDDSGLAICFQGTITAAWGDFDDAPNTCFHVEAHTGLDLAVCPTPPISYKGNADVATIMAGIASQMGLAFENNGVTAKLNNPYFAGSLRDQAKYCADHAGISWIIEDSTLAIWPKNGSRGGAVPLVSPETGMKGYPQFTAQGIKLTTLYNPSIGFGKKIKVQSDLTPACGIWGVFDLGHDLSCEDPGGPWFTRVQAYNPQFQSQPPVAQ